MTDSAATRMTRRHFGASLGVGALALNIGVGASAQTPAGTDLLANVNPEFRPFIADYLPMMTGGAPMSSANLAERRTGSGNYARPPLDAPAFEERTIPSRNGAPNVRIVIVNVGAGGATARPAILHTHGGGFVVGSASASIRGLQEITAALDCVAVSVDYRLAPETPFPGSLEDNYAGLKWLYANAEQLGVDRSRIAVMGESAGGGHAAMLAIAARDRGEVPLIYQALIYPMLDDRTGSTRRAPPHVGRIIWRAEDNQFGWTSLLGVPAGSRRAPAGAVPARVENLRGLPPAFIGVGSIDLFVDEDIEYARRLIAAGVATELVVVPGAFHGFDFVERAPIVQRFKASLLAGLRSAFGAEAV